MSRTIRYKLSEEEFRAVLEASRGLGISVDVLAKQALAYTLEQARALAGKVRAKESPAAKAIREADAPPGVTTTVSYKEEV